MLCNSEEGNEMSDSIAPNNSLNLRCTYCGGKIAVNMARYAYSEVNIPCAFECCELACGAKWNMEGTPESEPRYMRHPDLYSKSEISIADDE